MGDEIDEEPKRKAPKRKPLWLFVAAGVRKIEQPDGSFVDEQLFTRHRCDGSAAVRKTLEELKLDASNMPEIILLRAEPIELELGTQLVVKF